MWFWWVEYNAGPESVLRRLLENGICIPRKLGNPVLVRMLQKSSRKSRLDSLSCTMVVHTIKRNTIFSQPPPQALRFSHGRGERETSDW